MLSTLTELWNGNIVPCAFCGAFDPENEELIALRTRNQADLEAGLSTSQKTVFQKYRDCVEEYEIRIKEKAFAEGFSLAAKLLIEALS